MDSLVFELQRDSINPSIHITDLLRKALLVSRKLKITDIEDWINDELNGYTTRQIPTYRIVHGQVKARNPFHGWIPVNIPDDDLSDLLSSTNIFLSVSQIEDLAAKSTGGSFIVKFQGQPAQALMRMIGHQLETALHIPTHQLVKILDITKTKIMDFALDLESKGILGEGLVFTSQEKELASTITNNTINIHRMENSQIQQDAFGSDQKT